MACGLLYEDIYIYFPTKASLLATIMYKEINIVQQNKGKEAQNSR